jgi:hypothetical protein
MLLLTAPAVIGILLLLAGIALTLYIMRRRVRLGRRVAKF